MSSVVTLPNLLTGYRFAVIGPLLFFLTPGAPAWLDFISFVLFLSAALTDLADGYLARKHATETVLGKLLDPLADKLVVAAALILLIPMGRVPAWLSFLILAREIFITGLRSIAAAKGVVIAASELGKLKAVCQYTGLCVLIFPAELLPLPFLHPLGRAILLVALGLTLWSGLDYFLRFRRVLLAA
ncbi:MAG: CDP-diacylglycerol--glycerol-3-phosphate 3-phosphatidyltransferase [Thermodesulfobacteriota bacterium]